MKNNSIKLVKVVTATDGDTFQEAKSEFYGKVQTLKMLGIYGISYRPPANSFGVAFSANDYDDNIFVIADSPKNRFKGLAPGELKIGNYLTGDFVFFKADGSIEVESGVKITATAPDIKIIASTKVEITSPLVEVSGTVEAADFISPSVASYDAHVHSDVQSGGSNTGGPQ